MPDHHKKVLVTGGAGYIGSHTAKALAANGYIPVTIDNMSYGHRWAVKWGPLHELDICDAHSIKKIITSENIESMIHFAAFAYVGESVYNPRKYFKNNVYKTLALLDAALDSGIKHIVFSSSCATYGLAGSLPIRESDPQSPINPYGESKLFIEKVLQHYGTVYDLKWSVLRYFNAAGADLESEIGEVHTPETHLIPLTLFAAMGKSKSLQIFGDDYDTHDGTALRDYVHVSDLANAHVKALSAIENGWQSMALNLGAGVGYSVNEIVNAVETVTGLKVPRTIEGRRPGDPAVLVANTTLAKKLLNWIPQYSGIETIIDTAYKFFLNMEKSK